MSLSFPINTSVVYVVEERFVDTPSTVNHAWAFNRREEAVDMLVEQVSTYGTERLYTMYLCVD